jgi:hypothetical protein
MKKLKPHFFRIGPAIPEDPFFEDGIGCNGINAGINRGRLQVMVSRYRNDPYGFLAWNGEDHWVCFSVARWFVCLQYNDHQWLIGIRAR